jgi:hypothetical protein
MKKTIGGVQVARRIDVLKDGKLGMRITIEGDCSI